MRSKLAGAIYDLASKLSHESGVFRASTGRLAEYFKCGWRTALRAIQELEKSGFLVRIKASPGEAVHYRVVGHDEWSENHPHQCVIRSKIPLPYVTDPPPQPLPRQSSQIVTDGTPPLPRVADKLTSLASDRSSTENPKASSMTRSSSFSFKQSPEAFHHEQEKLLRSFNGPPARKVLAEAAEAYENETGQEFGKLYGEPLQQWRDLIAEHGAEDVVWAVRKWAQKVSDRPEYRARPKLPAMVFVKAAHEDFLPRGEK